MFRSAEPTLEILDCLPDAYLVLFNNLPYEARVELLKRWLGTEIESAEMQSSVVTAAEAAGLIERALALC